MATGAVLLTGPRFLPTPSPVIPRAGKPRTTSFSQSIPVLSPPAGYRGHRGVGPHPWSKPPRGMGLRNSGRAPTMHVIFDVCQYLAPLQPILTIGSVLIGTANLAVGIKRMRRTRLSR